MTQGRAAGIMISHSNEKERSTMGYNGVKESFQKFAVNQALKYLEKNPEA